MKTPWTVRDMPPQRGKTAIITGTGGLGYECALALAGAGATVILAGRNQGKGEASVARVRQTHPNAAISFQHLDLASLHSVHAFAERMASTAPKIDILLNNAAVMGLPKRQTTSDGFEMPFGTNHLGHFALTMRLLPLLLATPAPHVNTVSSTANRTGKINFDDLQAESRYTPFGAYSQSKIANILFAAELQRRADAAGMHLTSNCAHPGLASTDVLANGPGEGAFMTRLVRLLYPLAGQSPAAGALPLLYAATAPETHGFQYFGPRDRLELRGPVAEAKVSERARDTVNAARLWEVSEQLTETAFPRS